MKRLLQLGLLSSLASASARADVSIFEGPSGGVGNVVILDESGTNPPVHPAALQGIELLSFDFSGRTRFEELRADRPRLRTDVPGGTRVVLPLGAGSLYRFRRDGPTGADFGIFHVGPDGVSRVVWELPGTGATATDDPVATRLGIAVDGEAFLVGTTPAAGGNLIEVELASATAIDRTPSLAPQAFQPGGMLLLEGWGIGITPAGVLRFRRLPGETASFVPIPGGTPAFLGDGAVASADQTSAALVAGDAATAAHVYVLRDTGPAVQVTQAQAHLSGAGFLPDTLAGPTLALSPDGSTCAWRTEGVTRECFVRPVAPAPTAALQITSDTRFIDTLDDTGVLTFFSLRTVILVVGESAQAGTGAIEGGDFYSVHPNGHARHIGGVFSTTLQNLSGTSGDFSAPFLSKGELSSDAGIFRLPDRRHALALTDGSGHAGSLRRVDLGGGAPETLLDQAREIQLAVAAGDDVLLAVRRDLPDDRRDLVHVPSAAGSPATVLGSLPGGTVFDRPAARSDGTLALVITIGTDQWAGRVHLPGGPAELMPGSPQTYGPMLGFAPDGSVTASIVQPDGRSLFVAWTPAGAVVLLHGPVAGFVLPGQDG